ncbi:MAG: hypothetical protein ACYTG7_05995 [Planctomycetota bacterium]|jgi:hypothetical protein
MMKISPEEAQLLEEKLALHHTLRDQCLARNFGPRDWADWKADEICEVVDLADHAPRMKLLELSLEGDLSVVYEVRMPVPRWPRKGKLILGTRVVHHLRFEESWRWESPPGWAPLSLLDPFDVYHPNSMPSPTLQGALCLGRLPPAIQPKEIVLLGFYAVSLQSVTLDESDPLGVLNIQACDYFRQHAEYLPLTTDGFLDPVRQEQDQRGG